MNLSIDELKVLSIDTEENFKQHKVQVSGFFDIHRELYSGNQWYLQFLLLCGFKGYFNYSNEEIENEHLLYRDYKKREPTEKFFINHYLNQTNEMYGTNIKEKYF
jgi:hypothetical protein